MYKFILSALGASILLPASAFAACGTGQPCLSWKEAPRAVAAYQAPQPYYAAPAPRTPQLAGLGPDETLCPTTCPVSVDAPQGSKVLGCYGVCKTVRTAPQMQYRLVRVIRPIVYVRPATVYRQPLDCRNPCKMVRRGY